MSRLRYIEYDGVPVVSARDLYAGVTAGAGLNVGGFIQFIQRNKLLVENTDYYQIDTKSGPDILLTLVSACVIMGGMQGENLAQVYRTISDMIVKEKKEVAREDETSEITISDVAKMLKMKPRDLKILLHSRYVLMPTGIPYQKHVENGYFQLVKYTYPRPSGTVHSYTKPTVTTAGIEFIKNLITNNSPLPEKVK